MQRRCLIAVLVVSSALTFSWSVRAQDSLVSPQEIQANWVGKTVVGLLGTGSAAGKTVDLQLKADGTSELSGAFLDAGTWRLSEQGYCNTWKKIRAGQERCFTVAKRGASVVIINPDGSINSTVVQIR
jgi:hypothetical protein